MGRFMRQGVRILSSQSARTNCPVCNGESLHFRRTSDYDFFSCQDCGVIHLDPAVLHQIDNGRPIVEYRADYWHMETTAALDRSRGVAIARIAEAVYLAQRPVERVLDIGAGNGAALDELTKLLPKNGSRFYGVEKFPPGEHTSSPNYIIGDLDKAAPLKFDAGLCMEVAEHLTPAMLRGLIGGLAERSNDDACYVFNTGLASFARFEDPNYIDPVHRGHIMFWTVEAVRKLAEPFGFTVSEMPGRSWAFLMEKRTEPSLPFADRLYNALPENKRFLSDGHDGWGLLSLLAFEALRASYYYKISEERTSWALRLKANLDRVTAWCGGGSGSSS